ncbi:MAG: transaldolase [Planctomycetales bacterium]
MTSPLESLIASGTKLWLDSVDPELAAASRALGATGATSNPVIVSDLIKSGRFDDQLEALVEQGLDDDAIAWEMTDRLVRNAQEIFHDVWKQTEGNDGYVSFEVDPLLEDPQRNLPHEERVRRTIELAAKWSAGHENRMIKVPATAAGLDALEEIAASGATLNVTLIFTERQYELAREAIWRGAQRRDSLDGFKSVYSIFVSRVDVYSEQHAPGLSSEAQGQVGIANAKRIWRSNEKYWAQRPTKLKQEMIFASTGTKKPEDPPWKYVETFAGSDIETNPPSTNDAVQASGREITRHIDLMPSDEVLAEIDRAIDSQHLEETLMEEGVRKFVDPQNALLRLISEKRTALSAAK